MIQGIIGRDAGTMYRRDLEAAHRNIDSARMSAGLSIDAEDTEEEEEEEGDQGQARTLAQLLCMTSWARGVYENGAINERDADMCEGSAYSGDRLGVSACLIVLQVVVVGRSSFSFVCGVGEVLCLVVCVSQSAPFIFVSTLCMCWGVRGEAKSPWRRHRRATPLVRIQHVPWDGLRRAHRQPAHAIGRSWCARPVVVNLHGGFWKDTWGLQLGDGRAACSFW